MALTQFLDSICREIFNVCLEMTDDAIYHKAETLEFTLESSKNFIIYSAPSYLKNIAKRLGIVRKTCSAIPFYV